MPDEKQDAIVKSIDFTPGRRIATNCQECAACCVAYSVYGIKGAGDPCPNLTIKNGKFECIIYDAKPATCQLYDCRSEKNNTKSQRERIKELSSAYVLNIIQLNNSKK